MKNTIKVFTPLRSIAIIALAAVIGFSMAGCQQTEDEPTPQTVTYQGTAGGVTYTLKITENTGRAAYTPQSEDSYELTVGTKKSSGTVESFSVSDGKLTLRPSKGTDTFTTTVSSEGISTMTGTITFDDGATQPAPTTLTPIPPSSGNNGNDPFAGTWEGQYSTQDGGPVLIRIVATNGSWKNYGIIDNVPRELQRGTYSYNGNAVTLTIKEINTWQFTGVEQWYSFADIPVEYKEWFPSDTFQATINDNSFTFSGTTMTKTSSGNNGGDGSQGNTLTVTNAQVYTAEWDFQGPTFTQFNGTVTGLTYVVDNDYANMSGDWQGKPLTDVINGTPTVTVTDGKLNVTLGTPKTAALFSLDTLKTQFPAITISPSGAKVFIYEFFCNGTSWENTTSRVRQYASDGGGINYVYSDKDVNLSGTFNYTTENGSLPVVVAWNLKAGWNLLVSTLTQGGTGGSQQTRAPSADDKWVVGN